MKHLTKKVVAIVGPTTSGKTGIGVRLAKEFNGEIVSADSRQVYRGLDLGTGKDLQEYDGVKYHMIDIVNPEEKMTLFDYLPLARAAIEDILSRDKLPIIVGGTGLYVQGIVEGFELEYHPDTPPKIGGEGGGISRKQLNSKTIEQLNDILGKLDPEKHSKVDQKNRHRLIRAIELAQQGLRPVKIKPDFEVLQIGIDVPRNELHERIDRRVDKRFKAGMLKEVEGLLDHGVDPQWLIGLGLEYREITEYFLGIINNHFPISIQYTFPKLSNDQINERWKLLNDKSTSTFRAMSQKLKWRIHQFARRQLTWFRRFPEINWLSDYAEIKRFVKIFLEH